MAKQFHGGIVHEHCELESYWISNIKLVELIMQLQYTGSHEKPLSNLVYA